MMTLHPTKDVMKVGMVTHTATGGSGGDEHRPNGRSPRGKFQPPHNDPPIHRRGGIYSRPRKMDLFPRPRKTVHSIIRNCDPSIAEISL